MKSSTFTTLIYLALTIKKNNTCTCILDENKVVLGKITNLPLTFIAICQAKIT